MKSLQTLAANALFPRHVKKTWEASEGNMVTFLDEVDQLAKNVTLRGIFWGLDPIDIEVPVRPQFILPRYSVTDYGLNLRWDAQHDCISWWAVFDYIESNPKKSTFKGRDVPHDCTLTKYQEKNGITKFRYESKRDLRFWAQVTISNEPEKKKRKVEK